MKELIADRNAATASAKALCTVAGYSVDARLRQMKRTSRTPATPRGGPTSRTEATAPRDHLASGARRPRHRVLALEAPIGEEAAQSAVGAPRAPLRFRLPALSCLLRCCSPAGEPPPRPPASPCAVSGSPSSPPPVSSSSTQQASEGRAKGRHRGATSGASSRQRSGAAPP